MNIGSAIRHMREQLGLKLETVAIEAGTDAGNLSRIETGKQQPSLSRLERIARAMRVGVTDLYALVENVQVQPYPSALQDGSGPAYDDSGAQPFPMRDYTALAPEQRKIVNEFVKMLRKIA